MNEEMQKMAVKRAKGQTYVHVYLSNIKYVLTNLKIAYITQDKH